MSTNLPAAPGEQLLADMRQAYLDDGGNPMGELMLAVLEEVGGLDYLIQYAEDYPTQFVPILLRLMPLPAQNPQGQGQGSGMHLHIHPALGAGPLDAGKGPGVTIDAESD